MTEGGNPAFPTTHWSLVRRAGSPDKSGGDEALDEFLRRYQPALRAYLILTRHLPREQVDDELQGFILDKFIRGRILTHAQQGRGRLRTFLLTVLDNYLADRHRYEQASHRAPPQPLQTLADPAQQLPPARDDPTAAYDLTWARQLLGEALRRMEQACQATKRPEVWAVFDGRVLAPLLHDAPVVPYGELVSRLGLHSPTEACNVLVTAKRMFARMLREVVGEYVRDPTEIDDEIGDLKRILARRA